MIVTTVSATIRYSQDTGKGAWKVVELGAEGSVEAKEGWQQAQSNLYAELGKQMRQLWNNGTSTATNGQDRSESHVAPSAETEPHQTSRLHWCSDHQVLFKKRQKAGTVWYSHKAADGSWCNEEVGDADSR